MDKNEFRDFFVRDKMLKALENSMPASISYKIDKEGNVEGHMNGRHFEIDLLTAYLIFDRMKTLNVDFDTYSQLIKQFVKLLEAVRSDEGNSDKDNINSIKNFNMIFKDLGL